MSSDNLSTVAEESEEKDEDDTTPYVPVTSALETS